MPRKKPQLTREQALRQKPIKLVDAPLRRDEHGGGRIDVDVQLPRITRWIGGATGTRRKTFELDAVGVDVWSKLDGRTTVEQLIHHVAQRYDLNLRAAETSTVAFLQMLMKRGLVGMPMEGDVR